jgi:hypothetical protein
MKKILLYQPFKPFFITGLATLGIALFLYVIYPASFFVFSGYGADIEIENYRVWILISSFLFFLAAIYYVAGKAKLKWKDWMVILHYVFIVLFIVFFAFFSLFGSKDFQRMMSDTPLIVMVGIYGLVFAIDALLFLIGFIVFFINLFSLRNQTK